MEHELRSCALSCPKYSCGVCCRTEMIVGGKSEGRRDAAEIKTRGNYSINGEQEEIIPLMALVQGYQTALGVKISGRKVPQNTRTILTGERNTLLRCRQ